MVAQLRSASAAMNCARMDQPELDALGGVMLKDETTCIRCATVRLALSHSRHHHEEIRVLSRVRDRADAERKNSLPAAGTNVR